MSKATIEPAPPKGAGATHLRCGGCGDWREIGDLAAHVADVSDAALAHRSAFVIVYYCRRRKKCGPAARKRFARWLESMDVEVVGTDPFERPPR